MATFYRDTFTDADGTLIHNHTAETGHAYGTNTGFKIQNNRLYVDNATVKYAQALGVVTEDTTTKVVLTYRKLTDAGNLGITLGDTTGDQTGYHIRISVGQVLQLWQISSGSYTLLDSYVFSIPDDTEFTVRVETENPSPTTVRTSVYMDDVLRISHEPTFSTIPSSGNLFLRGSVAVTTTTGYHLEDVRIVPDTPPYPVATYDLTAEVTRSSYLQQRQADTGQSYSINKALRVSPEGLYLASASSNQIGTILGATCDTEYDIELNLFQHTHTDVHNFGVVFGSDTDDMSTFTGFYLRGLYNKRVRLLKYTAGSASVLGTYTHTTTDGSLIPAIKAEVRSNQIEVFVGGVSRFTAADSSSKEGSIHLRGTQAVTPTTGLHLDSITYTSVTDGAGGPLVYSDTFTETPASDSGALTVVDFTAVASGAMVKGESITFTTSELSTVPTTLNTAVVNGPHSLTVTSINSLGSDLYEIVCDVPLGLTLPLSAEGYSWTITVAAELGGTGNIALLEATTTAPYLIEVLPPTGKKAVTLTTLDSESWLDDPAYTGNPGGDANNIGTDDQLVYDALTSPDGYSVDIDSTGLITLTGAGVESETTPQDIDWYWLDAQDSYSATAEETHQYVFPLSIVSLSAGPYYVGDTVTVNVSNASASGKTLSIPAGALTVDSQDATTMTFTVPDPKTFGTKVSPYSSDITITADDGGDTDTIAFQISPTVGHAHATIAATTGIYADDVGIAIGDKAYGYWVVGTGSEDLTVGAIQSDLGGTFRYWIQDDTDSVWGSYADEVVEVGPDVTAPVLSSPTGTQTAYDTADGTVSTDEGNGTLYYYASQNASETASTIKASGSSQAVVSSGVQNVSYTGLTESTTYYAHYVQDDSSSNESNVVVSASFTTPAAPDVTAPVLTLGTGIATGNTTADGSVTTNEGSGTLYYYASVNAVETAATIKASGGSQAVGVSGVQSVGFTSLSTDTTYYAHYVQDDSSANESNVVSSAGFDMPDTVPPVLSLPTGAASGAYSATGSVTTDDSEGVIYYLATTNAVETAATVKASPRNRVVSTTGVHDITYTGLTPETTYYLHYIHIDGGDNESDVASSASFTTGVASAIPPSSRESVNKIADYLRSTEAHTQQQTNTVVIEWLLGEGISKSQLNQMLYTYLLGLGYTGSINDMLNKWSRDG